MTAPAESLAAEQTSEESSPTGNGGYAVELYFDPALENQVLKAWNSMARRQFSSHLIHMAARPHIPLLTFPAAASSSPPIDPLRLFQPLRSLAARLDPIPLSLSTVASFPATHAEKESGFLFLAPTPTAALLGIHTQLCELLKREGLEPPEGSRPDAWIPHCAVAQEVPKPRVADAFAVLREFKLPVSGYAMDIGLVELVHPVREIFLLPLGVTTAAAAEP